MPDAHANLAVSVVATAPSPATSGTSLVVTAGQGTRFPAVPFNATVWSDGALPDPTNAEIVRVTARTTDTLTITRAQESTSARTIVVGDRIAATITAKTLTDVEAPTSTVTMQPATDTPGLIVKQSAAGTTANLQTWQNSAAGELAAIGGLGQVLEGGRRLADLTSRLTSAGIIASATQTATGLSVTLGANRVYLISIIGTWTTANIASTWAPRMNFSGTFTGGRFIYRIATNTTAVQQVSQTANATAVATQTAAVTSALPFTIDGVIRCGASGGNLAMEHARPAGANNVQVDIDTILRATEVA